MKQSIKNIFLLISILSFVMSSRANFNKKININNILIDDSIEYIMPEESEPHEGTWLQWPHHYYRGIDYRNQLEPTWIEMTKALVSSEKVHIIIYNETEKKRVIKLLNNNKINLNNIDFKIYETDDVWVRDNGPIFVRDKKNNLIIQDWGFNGWGEKYKFEKDNMIPKKIGNDLGYKVIDLNSIMINEGGAVEIDGRGTMLACKSSILSQKQNSIRNYGITQEKAEAIFKKYLGITNFIWLEGFAGLINKTTGQADDTDLHIDGFARFGNSSTIVTLDSVDLINYPLLQSDIDKLYSAKNKEGIPYKFLKLPLTKNIVFTTFGKNTGEKGSYCNFYIGNTVVLATLYNDPNDKIALEKLQTLYPNKKVIGIDVRNLFSYGGMVHCVTQQQPK